MILDKDGDVIRKTVTEGDKVAHVIEQDESAYIDQNTADRNEVGRMVYAGSKLLHRAMNIPLVGIEKLMRGQCCVEAKVNNQKYNLLSGDPDERRRAILHIQNHHKEYMVVPGNPFGRKKTQWQ